jgi:long-chain acyl-CoA synthetase
MRDSLTTVQEILRRLHARSDQPILWEQGREFSAGELLDRASAVLGLLQDAGVGAGSVVGFCGDWSLNTVASFLALIQARAIAVPFSPGMGSEMATLAEEAAVEWWLDASAGTVRSRGTTQTQPLLQALREVGHPGLIVFTSGSSGKAKAILHDVERVASKFSTIRPGWRMVMFLLPDHFGGFNTLLACLAYGGVAVCAPSRTPDDVCAAVDAARADLLPTTPTFLSLLIASGAWRRHSLASIRLVTYGAEPMPEATLRRLPEIFSNAELKQTYGLSELGVLQSASVSRDSLWLKVGGRDFETRVVDGMLHIRSGSSMLGYLNAASPIDEDGWMNTGDLVEERGELIRIIGRVSDVVNVGGQKVFPVEVESVLQEHRLVAEATVYALPHPVLGQVVGAKITLHPEADDEAQALQDIKLYCRERMQKYKIPMRWQLVGIYDHGNERGKKVRR